MLYSERMDAVPQDAIKAGFFKEIRPHPGTSYALTNNPDSMGRRMVLDLATRRAAELLEVQILYLLAGTLCLLVVDPWAIVFGYLAVQISEIHGMTLARRIFKAAANPNDMLQSFVRPVLVYKYTAAVLVSVALGNGLFHADPDWQLGILAIWCMSTAYFVFPTVYCVRSLYGCILIHSGMMAGTVIALYWTTEERSFECLVADLGLCVFAAIMSSFIGRHLRADYVRRLDRERELARTIEELDRQNAEKTDFVGHLSHELRTPMNGLMGMAALLRQDLELPEQRHKLDIMLKSGATLVELLNNSLDLSKLEAGAVGLDTGSYALKPLLQDQVELYSATAEAKGIKITLEVMPGVPDLLLMDSLRVMQVIGNLVSNAVKFSETGKIEVVADYEQSLGSPLVIVTVKDQGIGIPSERIDAVFNAYSQAHSNVPRDYPGAGLGLAISSRLAKLMGGSLQVGSKVGEGSTFYFSFIAIEAPSILTHS